MFNELKKNKEPNFGVSLEDLDKGEVRYSIFGIYNTLTLEQLSLVDENAIIAKYLTEEQIKLAEKNQREDNYFKERGTRTSSEISQNVGEIIA